MTSIEACVIVGAGHAGSQLAIQLRKEGWTGRITLLGDETPLPYHRPPLSKAVLAGEKTLHEIALRPQLMYDNSSVELCLGEKAVEILREKKILKLQSGRLLPYDKLALCLGARVIKLPLGENLCGVFYLRNAADVDAIKQDLAPNKRVVIIGGGYIGLEAAAVLQSLGLHVTVLERATRILQRVTSEPVSDYFTRLHQDKGIKIITGVEVTAINGKEFVESVQCIDGSQYPADIVIIGIGVVPETALAAAAGLTIENGIKVNQFAQTSDASIYAVGDCASHPSFLYQSRIRLESVQNANDQARVAAANLCGKPTLYNSVPWFWSDQYTTKLQSVGLSNHFDSLLVRGDPTNVESGNFTILYGRNGHLIAADCINMPKEFLAAKRLVQERVPWDSVLADGML